jgi:uncharacterized protein YndB with AHSA1/START domain
MPYRFTLTTTIPASAEEIYEAWLDSLGHSEMTGGEANMSDQVGAEVSAWDGYISGRNLELVPGERIVQSWRTIEFDDAHEDSVITVVLQEIGEGTLLTLEHSNVPDEQRSYEEGGWQSKYFEPMVAYFTERKEGVAETARQEAPKKKNAPKRSAAKTSPKKAAKRPAKSAHKAERAASAKSKRPAPRAKISPKKSKSRSKGKARSATARKR